MAYKLIEQHKIGDTVYEMWSMQVLWGRHAGAERIVYKANTRRIAKSLYDHRVRGVQFPKVELGTCQICLRQIGVTTGTIAHHGYQRPHQGWQTASCMGAKFRSLELACDAIPHAINRLRDYVASLRGELSGLINDPPAMLGRRDAYGKIRQTYFMPEGFDTQTDPASYRLGYESLYWSKRRTIAEHIKYAQADIQTLTERLASWRPA